MTLSLSRQLNALCDHLESAKKLSAQIREETSGTHRDDLASVAYAIEKAIDIVHKQLYVAMCGAGSNNPLTF